MLLWHLVVKMSRFCKFFLDYRRKLRAAITSLKFWRSSLLQFLLETPLELVITHLDHSSQVFHIMDDFIGSAISQSDASNQVFHIIKNFIELVISQSDACNQVFHIWKTSLKNIRNITWTRKNTDSHSGNWCLRALILKARGSFKRLNRAELSFWL